MKSAPKQAPVRLKTKSIAKVQVSPPTQSETEKPVPEYLVTPSKAVLKAFREEARKRQESTKKALRAKTPGANFYAAQPRNGKSYTVDLRIHSPATKGYFSTAGVEAGAALVRLAKVKGIDIVGLTDYYSASFVDVVKQCAEQSGVTVVPGFDMCCHVGGCDDVHFVVLFPETFTSSEIFAVLSELRVPSSAHGRKDYRIERSFTEVLAIIESRRGVVIPSRIDMTPHSQSAATTLIEEHGFHAFDLVHPENTGFFSERWPRGGFSFFSFSNANALAQIGSRTAKIKLTLPGYDGIKALVERRASARI